MQRIKKSLLLIVAGSLFGAGSCLQDVRDIINAPQPGDCVIVGPIEICGLENV